MRLAAALLSGATIEGTVKDASGRNLENARIDHVGKMVVVAAMDLAIKPSADEIRYSDGERWAEPLERNVTNVLAVNLSRLLARARVVAYPQPPGLRPAYQIEVEIGRLDTTRAGEAALAAHWTIEDLGTRDLLASRDSYLTRAAAGTGTPAAVAALSGVLAELSQEIASTVRDLRQKAS